MRERNRPVIETIINTVALALTSYGVINITQDGGWDGYVGIAFGMALEFLKYYGRNKDLW